MLLLEVRALSLLMDGSELAEEIRTFREGVKIRKRIPLYK